MQKQRQEESEKRKEEERRSEKKENAGARKSKNHESVSMFFLAPDSRGSKSRLAKAAGAEPVGQLRGQELHAVHSPENTDIATFIVLTANFHAFLNGFDLASLVRFFRGMRNTLDKRSGKNAKRIGTRLSAQHSTFHFEGILAELFFFF